MFNLVMFCHSGVESSYPTEIRQPLILVHMSFEDSLKIIVQRIEPIYIYAFTYPIHYGFMF